MWVTSFERNDVSKRANMYEHGREADDWFLSEHYLNFDPLIRVKANIYANICYIVREALKEMATDVTVPEARTHITTDMVMQALRESGVDETLMPRRMFVDMIIMMAIGAFLDRQRRKYDIRLPTEVDEMMPFVFYYDGVHGDLRPDHYAIICGEGCKFSREYKGWRLYVAGYVPFCYILSDYRGGDWYKKCRYFAVDNNLSMVSGRNLADVKSKVNAFMRGEIR